MSAFFSGGGANRLFTPGFNGVNKESLQRVDYSTLEPYTDIPRLQDADILWTRSAFPQMYSSGAELCAENSMSQNWEWYWPPTGGHYRKVVSGIVKNSSGQPVSGAVVQLFNTATGLLVDTSAVTGSDGVYKCGDPNGVPCFSVGYLTDSPDTAGTTVNTIAGV